MSKFIATAGEDAELNYIAGSTRMTYCSAQPANFAGIAAVALTGPTTPAFTGPAAGTPNGRQITVGAVSGVAVTANGSTTHVAFDDGTTLRFVDTCPAQAVTTGGTLSASAFIINAADPV
jgi:hypothetical protein